jgi:hypothetical protein
MQQLLHMQLFSARIESNKIESTTSQHTAHNTTLEKAKATAKAKAKEKA